MIQNAVNRRTVLGGGLAGAGIALTACGRDNGGSGTSGDPQADAEAIRPNHIPYDGPTPDLEGDPEVGIPNG
ncbi:MAG TPA: hypothetical protein IAA98_03835, partial [Candidatus Avipropionibacterium avicola]|nr:hypothetical protein [Candidatus Avipropionibacterium avicola]